jgi:hypothetical protein
LTLALLRQALLRQAFFDAGVVEAGVTERGVVYAGVVAAGVVAAGERRLFGGAEPGDDNLDDLTGNDHYRVVPGGVL